MNVDRAVMAFAGFMVLLSVGLSQLVHPAFFWLTVFVGANMLQAAFTSFCPAALIFKKMGLPAGKIFS